MHKRKNEREELSDEEEKLLWKSSEAVNWKKLKCSSFDYDNTQK